MKSKILVASDYVDFIQKTIGEESSILSKSALIGFHDGDLAKLLGGLSVDKRTKLINSISSFYAYFQVIHPCEGVSGYGGIWTNLILILLFALIEKVMGETDYVDCFTFINSALKDSSDTKISKEMLEDWRAKHGSNEKIRIFFKKFITKSEENEIIDSIKSDPEWNSVSSIDGFVSRIMKLRSGFVHALSFKSVSEFNANLKISVNGDIIGWYPTMSIDRLIHFVLCGIFRKYDDQKVLKF